MAAKRTLEILEKLDEVYTTDYKCYLNHENPGQLLIATMLSAQCTDARVNIVTETLFKKYPTMEAFANADLAELEQDIKPTGFYHNKAKNIIGCARKLVYEYGGEVPNDLDALVALPGVGRKTANVIPKDHWILINIQLITFGRQICHARGPKCEQCFLTKYCKEYKAK